MSIMQWTGWSSWNIAQGAYGWWLTSSSSSQIGLATVLAARPTALLITCPLGHWPSGISLPRSTSPVPLQRPPERQGREEREARVEVSKGASRAIPYQSSHLRDILFGKFLARLCRSHWVLPTLHLFHGEKPLDCLSCRSPEEGGDSRSLMFVWCVGSGVPEF